MKGRRPGDYKLNAKDRRYLQALATDGQLIQRFANRARALLALDRGERIVDILRWLGLSRTSLWELWQRYLERGAEAIFDNERSGRPATFSPSRTRPDRESSVHRADHLWAASEPLGLSQPSASGYRASPR